MMGSAYEKREHISSRSTRNERESIPTRPPLQVLLNLLANAVKFTEQGGISVRAVPTDDGTICIHVTDSGMGIAPAHQARVFEEFRQVQDALHPQQCTGLGLPISKRMVELHRARSGCRARWARVRPSRSQCQSAQRCRQRWCG
jgi:signal transduction histidine kinase